MEILNTGPALPTLFHWSHYPGRWLAVSLLLVTATVQAAAPAAATAEYRLKAVFMFNFAQFVEWPPEAFAAADTPLVIGILGEDPFGSSLDEIITGEKIGARPLLVRRFKRADEVADCHILFISRSEEGRLDDLLTRLQDQSVLTVADFEGSARRGVMIRFMTENRKIRLRINLASARAARLTLSSKLLRPAEIVPAEAASP